MSRPDGSRSHIFGRGVSSKHTLNKRASKKSNSSKRRPGRHHLGNNSRTAIILAVLIVVLAIASWLYMSRIDMILGKADGEGYRNVTFTDAMLTCQNFARERYGARIRQLTLDSHSSRWEQRTGQYKLFFRTTMTGRGSTSKGVSPTADFWINCDVNGRRGKVRDFDLIEDKTQKNEAQRKRDGGLFGWP